MHTGRWVTRHLAEAHLQKARVPAHLLITAQRKSLNNCLNGKCCVYIAGNSQLSGEDVARQQAGSCTALIHVAHAVSAVQLAGLAHAGRVTDRHSGGSIISLIPKPGPLQFGEENRTVWEEALLLHLWFLAFSFFFSSSLFSRNQRAIRASMLVVLCGRA